jgi:membrane-bound acyltransferase YfiQ involved in biofilm formation
MKLISLVIRNRYLLLALGLIMVLIASFAFLKGIEYQKNKQMKTAIGKGIENEKILSKRPSHDDLIRGLLNGEYK